MIPIEKDVTLRLRQLVGFKQPRRHGGAIDISLPSYIVEKLNIKGDSKSDPYLAIIEAGKEGILLVPVKKLRFEDIEIGLGFISSSGFSEKDIRDLIEQD